MTTTTKAAETEDGIRTRDEAEAAGAQIKALELQAADARGKKEAVLMQARPYDELISDLERRSARHRARLEEWAWKERRHLGLVEPGAKSMELRHVVIGFRWTRPGVKLLKGMTEELVLEQLLNLAEKAKRFADFIRRKPSVDKQGLVADQAREEPKLSGKDLERIGVEVKRDEVFFIEVKTDQVTPAAAHD